MEKETKKIPTIDHSQADERIVLIMEKIKPEDIIRPKESEVNIIDRDKFPVEKEPKKSFAELSLKKK